MIRALPAALVATLLWQASAPPPIGRFVEPASSDAKLAGAALEQIAAAWKDMYAAMFIDMARLWPPRRTVQETGDSAPTSDRERDARIPGRSSGDVSDPPDRGSPIRRRLLAFLEERTGRRFGDDLDLWREWTWKLPHNPHPEYAVFKGLVYGQIDPRMRAFFPAHVRSSIRLDEIDWVCSSTGSLRCGTRGSSRSPMPAT